MDCSIPHPAPHDPPAYQGQLLEGQLEARPVVGDALGADAHHRLLQDLLVAHVGLHQVLEARRLHRFLVELQRGRGGGVKGQGAGVGEGSRVKGFQA